MPYVERTIYAGRAVFRDRYFTSRYKKKGLKRCEPKLDTKQAQELVNDRKTYREVAVMLDASFEPGDFHFVLTYKKGNRPDTPEEAQKDLRAWLKKLRKLASESGFVMKYIVGTEIGSKGGLHHHVIMNRVSRDWICDEWPHGAVKFGNNLDKSGEWSKLAAYIVKCKKQWKAHGCKGRAWSSSRNLTRPEPQIRIIRDREQFRYEPKPMKGYYIDKDKTRVGIHERTGYMFLSYIMVREGSADEDVGENLHRNPYCRKI